MRIRSRIVFLSITILMLSVTAIGDDFSGRLSALQTLPNLSITVYNLVGTNAKTMKLTEVGSDYIKLLYSSDKSYYVHVTAIKSVRVVVEMGPVPSTKVEIRVR